jgi:hypothetical protein
MTADFARPNRRAPMILNTIAERLKRRYKVCSDKVHAAKIRPTEVRLGEVRLYEYRPVELRSAEVRTSNSRVRWSISTACCSGLLTAT